MHCRYSTLVRSAVSMVYRSIVLFYEPQLHVCLGNRNTCYTMPKTCSSTRFNHIGSCLHSVTVLEPYPHYSRSKKLSQCCGTIFVIDDQYLHGAACFLCHNRTKKHGIRMKRWCTFSRRQGAAQVTSDTTAEKDRTGRILQLHQPETNASVRAWLYSRGHKSPTVFCLCGGFQKGHGRTRSPTTKCCNSCTGHVCTKVKQGSAINCWSTWHTVQADFM